MSVGFCPGRRELVLPTGTFRIPVVNLVVLQLHAKYGAVENNMVIPPKSPSDLESLHKYHVLSTTTRLSIIGTISDIYDSHASST
jgi:hypothetical protein